VKSIGLLVSRADLTPAAFRDYYETRHAGLAAQYFPFTRYIRNHLLDAAGAGADFHCYSEFWSDDVAALIAINQSPVGDLFRQDEARFMERTLNRPAMATEHVVAGSDEPATLCSRKRGLFLMRNSGTSDAEWLAALRQCGTDWQHASAGRIRRVVLDLVAPFPGRACPFDAVLQASFFKADETHDVIPKLPPAAVLQLHAWMDAVESVPASLLGNRRTDGPTHERDSKP
jgi:hypothetical protein